MGLKGTLLTLLTVSLFVPVGCRQHVQPAPAARAPAIRIRLLQNQEQALLAATQTAVVRAGGVERRLNFPSNVDVPLTLAEQGWQIGSFAVGSAGELVIEPSAVGTLRLNNLFYRGRYRFVPVGPGRFDVINDVDLESYLKGVLAKELPNAWGIEAFKAQAIAARTYALYEMKTAGAGRGWDVYADTRSQVYGGIQGESEKSRAATDATAGIVLAYGPRGRERIFKAYFSSCCGGIGQSAGHAMGDPDIPPLGEKYVGSLCNASRHFNWAPVVISKDELTRRIRAWGVRRDRPEQNMARLARLEIAETNQFGRPVRFLLTDERGARYSLNSEETRWACNADAPPDGPTLRSSFFKPVNEPTAIRFAEGHGFGHGVGLCQWCSYALAERGIAHEDIVRHAYPGAILVRAY